MEKELDDRKMKTLELFRCLIDSQSQIQNILSEKKIERSELFKLIKEYVFRANSSLFDWAQSTDKVLKENNYGAIEINISNDENEIFSKNILDFEKFPVRQFGVLRGSIRITINLSQKLILDGKIIFSDTMGKFIWRNGEQDPFSSNFHSVRDDTKFGKLDILDIKAILEQDWYNDENGERKKLPHPVDVINVRLSKILSVDSLLTHLSSERSLQGAPNIGRHNAPSDFSRRNGRRK